MPFKHFFALALLIAMPRAQATSMVPANLAQTVEVARQGFHGTVEAVTITQTPQGWGEQVTCRVSDDVYGTTAGQTVTWTQARQSEEVRIPSMPKFAVGEEHLVFLSGKAPGSVFQAPTALDQGDFRVTQLASGVRVARNAQRNAALLRGLDRKALTSAVTAREAKRHSALAGKALHLEAVQGGGHQLESVMRLAGALHDAAGTGTKPSVKFAAK